MSDHPLDCMTCEKTGSCKLQDLAYEMGLTGSRIERRAAPLSRRSFQPLHRPRLQQVCLVRKVYPDLRRDPGKLRPSIMPTGDSTRRWLFRIIGACTESDCVFCGQCVSVCPVGALTERSRGGKGPGMGIPKGEDHLFLLRGGLHPGLEREGRRDRPGHHRTGRPASTGERPA